MSHFATYPNSKLMKMVEELSNNGSVIGESRKDVVRGRKI